LESILERAANTSDSLVFSYWKNALISLESNLQFHKIPCVRIDGDRSADERIKALAAFRTDPSIRVMLLTFGTGSVGLTLTEATHVHLVEPHWNPMVEEQAIARAHRIGQDKPVSVWRYVVENSIEENIVRKQQRKLYFAKLTHASKPAQPGKADSNGGHGKQDDENLEHLLEDCSLFQG
jgi:SNF2 family DNA or RNA helicase